MAFRTSIVRRAVSDDRKRAREWAALYRLAQASPDGSYCLNPQPDNPEEQAFIYANDVSFLVSLLENFAKHGTFANIDTMGIERLLMREELKTLREGGMSYQDAIAELANKHNKSESTIERMVRLPSKRGSD